jgi:hypothetical protein
VLKLKTHLISSITVETSSPTFNTITRGKKYLDNSSHFSKIVCCLQKVRRVIIHPSPSQDDSAWTEKKKENLGLKS